MWEVGCPGLFVGHGFHRQQVGQRAEQVQSNPQDRIDRDIEEKDRCQSCNGQQAQTNRIRTFFSDIRGSPLTIEQVDE